MISALVALFRPLYQPILKLKLEPPHLPEGSALVRHLKPEPSWLTLKYLRVFLASAGQWLGVLFLTGAALSTGQPLLLGTTVAAWLLVLGILSFWLVATRLDFDLRHYLVGDKSLRVSQGAVFRREITLSYANVQNIEVTQGPLEKLLGLKSLTVSTAGGSAMAKGAEYAGGHSVTLEGLKNADELRELILGMLKKQKDAGLGDHAPHEPAGFDPALLEQVRLAAERLERSAAR